MRPNTEMLRHDSEWIAVVEHLRDSREQLLDDFLGRFDGSEVYAGKVPRDELIELVRNTMEMYLVLLTGNELDPQLARLPAGLGQRRVRQGVGLEQLLEGVRTNTRVIWNGLKQVAGTRYESCLVRNADTLFALVEWHVREVQSAYLAEESAMMRDRERRERLAVSRLFEEDQPGADELGALAAALGLDVDVELGVLAQLGVHDSECEICRGPGRTFVHELAAGSYHFGRAGQNPAMAPGSGPDARVATGGFVDGVPGLGALKEAATLASVLAEVALAREREGRPTLDEQGSPAPVIPFDAWPELTWSALQGVIPEKYLPVKLDGFAALSNEQQRRLRETVLEYFATGSIKATAERLFCHRNTVVKRLAAFESVTGLSLTVPRECALAVVAFAAAR